MSNATDTPCKAIEGEIHDLVGSFNYSNINSVSSPIHAQLTASLYSVAMRVRSCEKYRQDFKNPISNLKVDNGSDSHFDVEHNYLGFQFSALAAIENLVFGLAVMISIANFSDFPITPIPRKDNEDDGMLRLRELKVFTVANQLKKTRPDDELTKELNRLCKSGGLLQLSNRRNVMGHLGTPGMHFNHVDPEVFEDFDLNRQDLTKEEKALERGLKKRDGQVHLLIEGIEVVLDEKTLDSEFDWLTERLLRLVRAAALLLEKLYPCEIKLALSTTETAFREP